MKRTATTEGHSANSGYHWKSSELQEKKNYPAHGSLVQLTTSKHVNSNWQYYPQANMMAPKKKCVA
jgi:hypothetical protein